MKMTKEMRMGLRHAESMRRQDCIRLGKILATINPLPDIKDWPMKKTKMKPMTTTIKIYHKDEN